MKLRAVLLPPLVLIVVWIAAVWWPSRSAVASEQERLGNVQTEQLSLLATLDELNSATERLDAFEADIRRFELAIPSSLDMASLVRQLDIEADEAGIQIDLFAPNDVLGGSSTDSKRPVPAGMSSVSLSLKAQGSFEQALDFVQRLGNLGRLVVVDVLALGAIDGDARQLILDVEFRVFTTESLVDASTGASFDIDDVDGWEEVTPPDELLDRVRGESS